MDKDLAKLLEQLTLEEKAGLSSGLDFWCLKGVERLNIPSIMVADGPHGLRKQGRESDHVGLNESVKATCFPTASATASTWDEDLLYEMGVALGEECLQEDVAVILGPGANTKRSPLCGRNFEYISEDPYLTGRIGAALVNGIQSQGIGTSLKHFVSNNQEYRRMVIDTVVDERAFREIYLAGFENVIKEAQPWAVMCSYNRINGTFASDNKVILTDILKEEWRHTGLVMTDWGATNNRVKAIKAGMELEMPSSGGFNDRKIVEAVKSGELDEADLDKTVIRVLELIYKCQENKRENFTYDVDKHHQLARKIAGESAVLLKNDERILPLKDEKIVVIGTFANIPRYQGAGSSLINPTKLESALDELDRRGTKYVYEPGYSTTTDLVEVDLIEKAKNIAREAEVVLLYAGLTDDYESEGFDRTHLKMPTNQLKLIEAICEVNQNVVIVLQNGAPIEMPWLESVKAVLECYLGGQAGGPASIDVLYGNINPGGRLAETFPIKLEDDIVTKWFGMGPQSVEHRESIYVGYRYYDKVDKNVLFPFGYGLSYTEFEYSELSISHNKIKDVDQLEVSFNVKNTGNKFGSEVAQVYVKDIESTIFRPEKELKEFKKIYLEPEEEKSISMILDSRAFAYYNTMINDWHVESGEFEILVGSSSRDIHLNINVEVESTQDIESPNYILVAPEYYNLREANMDISTKSYEALLGRQVITNSPIRKGDFDINSTLKDISVTFIGDQLRKMVLNNVMKKMESDNEKQIKMMEAVVNDMPVRSMVLMGGGMINFEMADGLIDMVNGKFLKGLLKVIKHR